MKLALRYVVVLLVVFGGAARPAAAAAETAQPSVLTVGHSWTNFSFPQSPSGEFRLAMWFYGVDLNQDIEPGGYGMGMTVWTSSPRSAGRCGDPQLTMQANGAAVLHCGNHWLWATPTRGTGKANSFRIQDSGMLVVTTDDGRVVWRSHSGPSLLGAGHRLAPGSQLRNCPPYGPCVSLTMRRDGDLVLCYGLHVDWQTDTHRTGSVLVFRRSGALQVVGPAGQILWRSHTDGIGVASYLILGENAGGTGGRIDISSMKHPRFRWYRE